jgi:hypothetical protein
MGRAFWNSPFSIRTLAFESSSLEALFVLRVDRLGGRRPVVLISAKGAYLAHKKAKQRPENESFPAHADKCKQIINARQKPGRGLRFSVG